MADLIDRQAAIAEFSCCQLTPDGGIDVNYAIDFLKQLPSAQCTGRWIVVSDGYGNGEATACICECSECKDTIWVYKKSDRKWNFCPNCGCAMKGEDE